MVKKRWTPSMKRCTTCGCTFVQRKRNQRRCADCIAFESVSYIQAIRRNASRRNGPVSRLDANIRAANAAGMSYGKYMATKYEQTWTLRK